jgi:hypothetical protein
MIFYASLMVLSVAISAIVVWIYRSFAEASRKSYQAFLPSGKDAAPTVEPAVVRRRRWNPKAQATPWGWKTRTSNDRVSVATPAYASAGNAQVGWPYRSEPYGQEKAKPANLRTRPTRRKTVGTAKPWGW